MVAGQLLPDMHYLLQSRVHVVTSLSGALIQANLERQLMFVEGVSDETENANLVYLLLELSRRHG
jgi:hypothetical protein